MSKIVLTDHEPGMNPTSEELAVIVLSRTGLMPRKKGSTEKMHRTFLELYERAKLANREKRPEKAVMTVEEMGTFAGITRQTMYDYLKRWLDLNLIIKTSYIKDSRVIIGYKLNGYTLETAFEKAAQVISANLENTQKYIIELQRLIKNEKIAQTQKDNLSGEESEDVTIVNIEDNKAEDKPFKFRQKSSDVEKELKN